MVGRPARTPSRAACLALFLALLLPGYARAQVRSASFADEDAGQSAESQKADAYLANKDIFDMDIEQLARAPVVVPSMDIPVSSVTKRESTVGRSAAAVFVITPEMIRRSGATCIPEALRMAPGVEVAQVNSNVWAVTIRGFNSAYSGKLLVLIDGRPVYNPDFSGVYWNVQDVLLEDIERIEVVRGPGGTLWGANAVNGVINVITKKAKDTQGVYASAGGGTHEKMLDGFRYGGLIGEDLHYRVYGKHFERGANYDPSGAELDDWRQGRFGFRADWEPDRDRTDSLTVQGDHYVGNTANGLAPMDFYASERQTGENLLFRWRRRCDEDSDWTLLAYYDKFSRSSTLQSETVKTFSVDLQYRFLLTDRHRITCGVDFRNVESDYTGGDQFTDWFPYPNLTTNYTGQFIQDDIKLVEDRLAFIVGTKLEQNPYTGLEYQPSARLLWTPSHRRTGWLSFSRAVRTPMRAEEQFNATFPPLAPGVYPRIIGNSGIASEDMFAYEIGYREQTTDRFSWDIALFYNYYQRLIGAITGMPYFEPTPWPPHLIVPMTMANGPSGETYGVELASNYSVSERWRLYAQYTFLDVYTAESPVGVPQGFDPRFQFYLRSSWNLRDDLEFDLTARYVDRLVFQDVPSYISIDLRLAWRPREHLEMAVVGQNLLDNHRIEFPGGVMESPELSTEVPRGMYGTLTWRR